jgi:large-conductance mechanosensitive channel
MEFKNQITEFISKNNVVGTCTGVITALVTKDVVLSLVADVIIPLILILLLRFNIPFLKKILPERKDVLLNITKFLSSSITWVLTIIITFLFIQFAFFKFLGVTQKKDEKSEVEKKNNSASVNTDIEAFTFFK